MIRLRLLGNDFNSLDIGGCFPLNLLDDLVLSDFYLEDILVLLVGKSCILEISKAEKVGQDEKCQDYGVVCGLKTVVHDGQSSKRLKQVSYARARSKRTNELLRDCLDVPDYCCLADCPRGLEDNGGC